MPKSRDSNHIAANDFQELQTQLNFILQRLSDRLDKLEGLRGEFAADSAGDFGGAVSAESFGVSDGTEKIHSMGG